MLLRDEYFFFDDFDRTSALRASEKAKSCKDSHDAKILRGARPAQISMWRHIPASWASEIGNVIEIGNIPLSFVEDFA